MFNCTESNCKYSCKRKSNLKTHLWNIHNIGNGKIFNCTESNCNYSSKQKSNLKRHLTNKHDIGPYECEFCWNNVSKLTNYKCPKKKEIVQICRKCYRKSTGYSTRVEKQMVEYIKKDFPYIILEDRIIKGDKCDTKRRPDLVLSSTKELVICIECDEGDGHIYRDKSCELERMNEILDELQSSRVVFIRWNPDSYKKNGKRFNMGREDRLKSLTNLLSYLINKKDWQNDYIMVYYMFYSDDNS